MAPPPHWTYWGEALEFTAVMIGEAPLHGSMLASSSPYIDLAHNVFLDFLSENKHEMGYKRKRPIIFTTTIYVEFFFTGRTEEHARASPTNYLSSISYNKFI